MVCCLLCFSDEPVPDDPKAGRVNQFQITMMDGLCKNQPVCCLTCFCAPCSAYYTRYRVLDGDMSRYVCCQGYMNCSCFKAGSCGEKSCPECCLCLESFFCLGLSMSSSRMFIMDRYDLRPDPCDNRLIRFNNCLQILSCVCDILAIFIAELRELAQILRCIANATFYTLMGCMAAQVNYEVDYQKTRNESGDHLKSAVAEPYYGEK